DYYRLLDENVLPLQKGIFLTEEDIVFRRYILDLTCKGKTSFVEQCYEALKEFTFPQLNLLQKDGLVKCTEHDVTITDIGMQFVRVISSAFDLHL
ncbi:hypothetical protein ABIZ06_14990, partial [Enterococcus faecium]